MTEEKDIRMMVDEDIALAKAVWAASSYDSEVMGELFYHLMERYKDEIEDFMKGLKVIQSDDFPYERIEGGKNYPFSKNRTTQLIFLSFYCAIGLIGIVASFGIFDDILNVYLT